MLRVLCLLTLVPLRDRLQLERRVFDGPILLTLPDELVRCQMAERAMWSALIVIDAPRFDRGLCVVMAESGADW